MYLTAREKQILEVLLSKTEPVKMADLSEILQVSRRTVQRDVKALESLLKTYHLSIEKKISGDLSIQGEPENQESLLNEMANRHHLEYTADERQILIICSLLEAKGPLKLHTLASGLDVSSLIVGHDLNAIDDRLAPYQLSLIRKRGYGIEITGHERDKRQCMSDLLADRLNETEFISAIKRNITQKNTDITGVTNRLLGLVGREKILVVEDVVSSLRTELADSAMVGLIVHTALAVERLLNGEKIVMHASLLDDLKQTEEFDQATHLAAQLSERLNIIIPAEEIGFITMHLRGAKLRRERENVLNHDDLFILQLANQLIDHTGEALGTAFHNRESLLQGLIAHLKPSLYRIRHDMPIQNPLLDRIRTDYPKLFGILKKITSDLLPDEKVPDTEVGYLVMHFGASLRHPASSSYSALVICSSGIGSSKLLASRLNRDFPEITEIENGAVHDIYDRDVSAFDLILSTISIETDQAEVIEVTPFLSEVDKGKVKQALTELNKRKTMNGVFKDGKQSKKDPGYELTTFDKIRDYTGTIYDMINLFTVSTLKDASPEKQLTEALEQLNGHCPLVSDVSGTVSKLIERERSGGLGIPGSDAALFHTRSEAIMRPSFSVFRLDQPVELTGMDNRPMTCDTLLLLLAPAVCSQEVLEVLSEFSTMMIEEPSILAAYSADTEDSIKGQLTNKMTLFLQKKLKQLGVYDR